MSGVLVAWSMRSVTPRISAGPMPVSAAPVAAATSTTVDRPPGIVSSLAITERRANAKPTAKRAPMVVKNTPTEMFWVSDSTLYSEPAESILLESPSKLPFPKKMHAAKSTPALAPNRRMSESEITELPSGHRIRRPGVLFGGGLPGSTLACPVSRATEEIVPKRREVPRW